MRRRRPKPAVVQDYSALFSEYERAHYHLLVLPWKGARVPALMRRLTQAQIYACGEFSLIETFQDKIDALEHKLTKEDVVSYVERMHEVVKAALVRPTYEDLVGIIGGNPRVLEDRKILKQLEARVKETPDSPERRELEEEINSLRIMVDLILPEDFMAGVFDYALGVRESEIKKVSEEQLLEAAVLAEKGHDNPADHLHGPWDELPSAAFFRDDINKRAWIVRHRFLEEQKERSA